MVANKLDLVLRGGHVIDPANRVNGKRDVGICQGKIACVEENIPVQNAAHAIDVSGLIVTPGLLDIHVHAYVNRLHRDPSFFTSSLNADAHFPASGVTTCVDTGTAGCQELEHFRRSVMEPSITRILAYVNISAPGMGGTEQDIGTFDVDGAAKAALEHRDVVVGIKTAHYWTRKPFDDGHPAWESVERAVDAGDGCAMPVMVDFWPRPPIRSYPELILDKLRPGDIHTHVFARQFPIIDTNEKVEPYMAHARERGIWFDLGHGAASFWWRNGARAIAQGFVPDSISTDLHMGNIRGPVFSMQETMSKCLAMGMPLGDVIYRSTVTPAKAIGRKDLGTLSIGAEADVAVLERQQGAFAFWDCGYTHLRGSDRLVCKLTLRAGDVVFDRDARTVPAWAHAPEAYWPVTEVPVPVPRLWRD